MRRFTFPYEGATPLVRWITIAVDVVCVVILVLGISGRFPGPVGDFVTAIAAGWLAMSLIVLFQSIRK